MVGHQSTNTCVVLLRNLGNGMLSELVRNALDGLTEVESHVDRLPDGVVADLVIQGDNDVDPDASTTLLVAEDGTALCALPCSQLTEALLTLAVNASRTRDLDWLDVVLVACRRIDVMLERATTSARRVYDEGGDFSDWASARTRPIATDHDGDRGLGSPIATTSASASKFLSELHGLRPDGGDDDGDPMAAIVHRYQLSGREIDVLLLCFAAELDARYGRRFAYLRQDPSAMTPTIDLVATLLATDTADRLDLQRDLLDGPLVAHGLIHMAPGGPGQPLRSRDLGLDPTVSRLLLSSAVPASDQHPARSRNYAPHPRRVPAGDCGGTGGRRTRPWPQPSPLRVDGVSPTLESPRRRPPD